LELVDFLVVQEENLGQNIQLIISVSKSLKDSAVSGYSLEQKLGLLLLINCSLIVKINKDVDGLEMVI
jgi:hypothetical protein